MKFINHDLPFRRTTIGTGLILATGAPIAVSDSPWTACWSQMLGIVDVPALTPAQLPQGSTCSFAIISCDSSSLANILATTALGTVTAGNSGGSNAVTFATRLPGDGTHIGMTIYPGFGSNASGVPVVFQLAFSPQLT
jgi:hypothetical protein